ncbi:hypothetical protein QCA50_003767 [Cerrena zonata]|uniref:PWWP domain-containing protein n=1 Tax=Cerrena zonata TaxID=2478898 RepID=A0AAW0GPI0_9APHY
MSKKGAKTAQAAKEVVQYELRDIVLAKVRGYPPWPGMIVDPDSAPKNVGKERPNGKGKKGLWYCVRFFPAGDYAWLVGKDISRLLPHEIQAYIQEPFKRSGDLLEGYKIAQDPRDWEASRDALQAEAAENEANEEVDQLDSEGEEEAEDEDEEEKKTKSKKRKRDSEPAPKKAKAKPKKEASETSSTKKKPAGKGKKNGVKSKAMIESEDEGAAERDDEDAGPSQKASPPPAKKARKEKDEDEGDPLAKDPDAIKVRDWRHKLQKAFLGKIVPKDEDMPSLAELFTTVEKYENMNIGYLSFSKIGKVMRHIHALTPDKVPRDDEFHFKDRAKALVDKWHDILNANKTPAATNGKEAASPATTEPTKATAANGAVAEKAEPAAVDAAVTNGTKEEEPEKTVAPAEPVPTVVVTKDSTPAAMDVDADAKGEADADAPADADAAGDESVLADVTMAEAT